MILTSRMPWRGCWQQAPRRQFGTGPAALKLAVHAFKAQQNLETGETIAMALAEAGQFDRAAQLQRAMAVQAQQLGNSDLAEVLRHNLILYEHHQACRTPWRDDDPIFKPSFAQNWSGG